MAMDEKEILWNYAAPTERKNLARYVLETIDEISKIVKEAEEDLKQIPPWREPSFDAYVRGEKGRVRAQVKAIFQRLQKGKPKAGKYLTYRVEPPDSPSGKQRIRPAREILHYGHSECLGWVLLSAACILNVRLNPLIIVTRHTSGAVHAMLGYWLTEQNFEQTVVYGNALQARLPHEIRVVNVTRIAIDEHGGVRTFEEAEAEAHDELLPPSGQGWGILFAVDVQAARQAGIEPLLPLRPWSGNHSLAPADAYQDRPEFGTMSDFWREQETWGVLALIGMGGAGKTSLLHRFLAQLPNSAIAVGGVPKDETLPTPDALFVWNFYAHPDSDLCATALYNYLTKKREPGATFGQVQEVLDRQWRGCRVLLVFDGLERLQTASSSRTPQDTGAFGQFLWGESSLAGFLSWVCDGPRPVHVIVASRFGLTDLQRYQAGRGYHVVDVSTLPEGGARALLRQRGVKGSDQELDALVREFGNHAQTLDLLAHALRIFHGGLPGRARELPPLEEVRGLAQVDEQAARRRRILRFYEARLPPDELATLQRLCLFHIIPVTQERLARIFLGRGKRGIAGSLAGLTPVQLAGCLLSLSTQYHLVAGEASDNPKSFSVHPSVREYFYATIADKKALHDSVRQYLAAQTTGKRFQRLHHPQDLDLLEELIYQCVASGHRSEAFEVYIKKMGSYTHLGARLGAYARGRRVISLFAVRGGVAPTGVPPQNRARLLNAYGGFSRELGDLPAAARAYRHALKIAARTGDEYNTSVALRNLPIVLLMAGRLRKVQENLPRALAYMERVNDTEGQFIAYSLRAYHYSLLGNIREAIADFDLIRNHFLQGSGQKYPVGIIGVWYSNFLMKTGRLNDARGVIQNGMKYRRRWGSTIPRYELTKAELERLSHNVDLAGAILRSAFEKALRMGDQEAVVWAHLIQARLALDINNLEKADVAVREGMRVAEQCGYDLYWIDLQVAKGQWALMCGRRRSAGEELPASWQSWTPAEWFERAATSASFALNGLKKNDDHPPARYDLPERQLMRLGARHPECGYAWGEGDALQLLGEALLAQGRHEEARGVLEACLVLRERIQDYRADRTRQLLSSC